MNKSISVKHKKAKRRWKKLTEKTCVFLSWMATCFIYWIFFSPHSSIYLLGFSPWQIIRHESARALQYSTLLDLSQVDYSRARNAHNLRRNQYKSSKYLSKKKWEKKVPTKATFVDAIVWSTFHCGFNHQRLQCCSANVTVAVVDRALYLILIVIVCPFWRTFNLNYT